MKESCALCGHMDGKLVCDIHNSSFIHGRSDSHGCLYHQPESSVSEQHCVECSAFAFITRAETWGACAYGRKNLHKNSFVCELFKKQKEELMTTYFTKCGECTNYHPTGNEIGTCLIKQTNVSRHRPADECTDWSPRGEAQSPGSEEITQEPQANSRKVGSMRITGEVIRRWIIAIPQGPISPEASATIAVNVNRGCTINSIATNGDGEIEITLELWEKLPEDSE